MRTKFPVLCLLFSIAVAGCDLSEKLAPTRTCPTLKRVDSPAEGVTDESLIYSVFLNNRYGPDHYRSSSLEGHFRNHDIVFGPPSWASPTMRKMPYPVLVVAGRTAVWPSLSSFGVCNQTDGGIDNTAVEQNEIKARLHKAASDAYDEIKARLREAASAAYPGLADGFCAANETPKQVPEKLYLHMKHVFLGSNETDKLITGEPAAWEAFGKKYPTASARITFSAIGFSENRKHAALLALTWKGKAAGAGELGLALFERRSERFWVEKVKLKRDSHADDFRQPTKRFAPFENR